MESESINKINLTSLVDVSLTLVIIFMVVAPYIVQTAITVTSSRMGESRGKVAQSDNVTVKLDEKGEIAVNGSKTSWDELPNAIRNALKQSKDKLVMLLADPDNHVKLVVEVLDVARQQGAARLAILKKK